MHFAIRIQAKWKWRWKVRRRWLSHLLLQFLFKSPCEIPESLRATACTPWAWEAALIRQRWNLGSSCCCHSCLQASGCWSGFQHISLYTPALPPPQMCWCRCEAFWENEQTKPSESIAGVSLMSSEYGWWLGLQQPYFCRHCAKEQRGGSRRLIMRVISVFV